MYNIQYHSLVLKEDVKNIPKEHIKRIVKAINKKLKNDPEGFGKPLLHELKGYFRLRIGFYRVIYRIEKEKVIVFIINIALRRNLEAYIKAAKRLGLQK